MATRIAAAVSVEQILDDYYSRLRDDSWAWVRDLHVGDGDSFLVVEDDDGYIWRVPFTVTGDDEVEYGEPVRIRYVVQDVADDDRGDRASVEVVDAATGEPVTMAAPTVQFSRPPAGQRPAEVRLRRTPAAAAAVPAAAEGAPADAPAAQDPPPSPAAPAADDAGGPDADHVTPRARQEAAVTQPTLTDTDPQAAPQPPPPAEPAVEADPEAAASEVDDDEEEGDDTAPAGDAAVERREQPAEPAPQPVAAARQDPEYVLIDRDRLARLESVAASYEAERAARQREDRERVVDDAIRAGKFAPARRDHWLALMEHDPDGTRDTIARLQPGAVPLEASGHAAAHDDPSQAPYEAFIHNMLPETRQVPQQQ